MHGAAIPELGAVQALDWFRHAAVALAATKSTPPLPPAPPSPSPPPEITTPGNMQNSTEPLSPLSSGVATLETIAQAAASGEGELSPQTAALLEAMDRDLAAMELDMEEEEEPQNEPEALRRQVALCCTKGRGRVGGSHVSECAWLSTGVAELGTHAGGGGGGAGAGCGSQGSAGD